MDHAKRVEELLKLPMHLCNRCGRCCKVGIFKGGIPRSSIQRLAGDESNPDLASTAKEFLDIYQDLSREEAAKIAPDFVKTLLTLWAEESDKVTFFTCKHLNDQNLCSIYEERPNSCKTYPTPQATTIYHPECAFKEIGEKNWQEILQIVQDLQEKHNKLEAEKQKTIEEAKQSSEETMHMNVYTRSIPPPPDGLCRTCGKCCRAAINRLSYEEIKELEEEGLEEAIDFLSIFEPYYSVEEAMKVAPDHVERLVKLIGYRYEKLTLYHCKYIDDKNLCTIYEKRPDVCRNAPNEAWALTPPECGFEGWLFELSEQAKKFVRHLKQFYYIKTITAENGIADKVPLEALCAIDIEEIDPWKPFKETLDLFNPVSTDEKPITTYDMPLEDLNHIINEKTKPWLIYGAQDW